MTLQEKAKERAQEIYSKYYIICQEYTEEIQCSIQAKQCALIAVDEMIEQQQLQFESSLWSCVGYWKEVKHEIEKL
jgi:hypothetical protein